MYWRIAVHYWSQWVAVNHRLFVQDESSIYIIRDGSRNPHQAGRMAPGTFVPAGSSQSMENNKIPVATARKFFPSELVPREQVKNGAWMRASTPKSNARAASGAASVARIVTVSWKGNGIGKFHHGQKNFTGESFPPWPPLALYMYVYVVVQHKNIPGRKNPISENILQFKISWKTFAGRNLEFFYQ